ncbi:MAG: hypothetical protein V1792_27130 [Pseudomonadota bacterium]
MIPRHPGTVVFGTCRAVVAALFAAVLLVLIPVSSWPLDPFPAKIDKIKMGDSTSSVIGMIKGAGTYEAQPGTEIQRPLVKWLLPNNPYYKELSFKFTEKDRLYLIRFDLKKISRSDLRAMKKTLFDKYGISWDDPWRLKVKGHDVLLYGPPEMGRVYYFEFSNPKTGDRAYEVLDRVMSAEDRPAKAASGKANQEEEPDVVGSDTRSVSPGDDSGSLKDSQPATDGKSHPEQPLNALPQKISEPLPEKEVKTDAKGQSQ